MRHIFIASILIACLPDKSEEQAIPHIAVIEPLECGVDKPLRWETSWYGEDFNGRPMANTELFDMYDPTPAAHKTLKFGTELLVTNPENCQAVQVTIKDRGPYFGERELDISFAAAEKIGFTEKGVGIMYVKIINQ